MTPDNEIVHRLTNLRAFGPEHWELLHEAAEALRAVALDCENAVDTLRQIARARELGWNAKDCEEVAQMALDTIEISGSN